MCKFRGPIRASKGLAALFLLLFVNVDFTIAQLGGHVFDAQTGKPVQDAHIVIITGQSGAGSVAGNPGTATRANGRFFLEWTSFPVDVRISALGYESQTRRVAESTMLLHVTLTPVVYEFDGVTIDNRRLSAGLDGKSPAMVTSIQPAVALGSGNTSGVDVLRSERGVYVQQTSPGQGSVYIRGRAGRDVLYLFNGLRMNPAFVRSGQNQYFGVIDPFSTQEMRVFRGPVSVYFGSDALSGGLDITPVVPSFTQDGAWSGGVITQINEGATGERTLHSHTSYTSPRLTWYLGGTVRKFSYYQMSRKSDAALWFPYDNRIDEAGYDYLAYTGSLRYRLGAYSKLTLVSFTGAIPDAPRLDRMIMGFSREIIPDRAAPDAAYDSNTAPLLFAAHSINLTSSLPYRFLSVLGITAAYHRLMDHRKTIPFGTPPDFNTNRATFTRSDVTDFDKNTSDQLLVSVDGSATPRTHTLVRFGADASYDRISSSRYRTNSTVSGGRVYRLPRYPDGSTYAQGGVFAHVNQRIRPSLWMEGGLRYSVIRANLALEGEDSERGFDRFSQPYSSWNGSLGASWSVSESLQFVANLSTGFRAPNVADLSELGERRSRFLQIPNPSLRPERTVNMDFGVRWSSDRANGELTLYRIRYADKIESVPTGSVVVNSSGEELLIVTQRNEQSMLLYGVESNAEFRFYRDFAAGLTLNYTFGELHDGMGSSTPVDRIPPINGKVYLGYHPGETFQILFQSRYALRHTRLSEAEKQDFRVSQAGTDGFGVLQLISSWKLSEQSEVRLFADNLLDTAYREHASSLDGPGRNLTLRYSYTF